MMKLHSQKKRNGPSKRQRRENKRRTATSD
jgi:hypothetical protein